MKINVREPSTQRGIVWIIGGGVVLVQLVRGQAVNPDAILSRVETWIGVAMTIAGLFGLLPDAPAKKQEPPDALPPIALQGRPESGAAAWGIGAVQPADELRLHADRRPGPVGTAEPITQPNPVGFGDRD